MSWTNNDGLKILFGTEQATQGYGGVVKHDGEGVIVRWDLDSSLFASTDTKYLILDNVYLPAGAIIREASLYVTTGFVGSGATLDIGLVRKDGTEIDYDGIDAAIAVTALDTIGERVSCDGALVASTGGGALGYDGYLCIDTDTATFTAGKAQLYIKYIKATI